METAGEFFRQVRETKGLTLDAVASKTCIHPDFLRALEDNNYAKLPDQVFVKGFVRAYARSLGLDEHDAMRRFVESAAPFYEKQGEREQLRQKQVEDDRRRKTSRHVAAAAAVVALLALVLLLTREQSAVPPPRAAGSGATDPELLPPPVKSAAPAAVVPPVPVPAEALPVSREAPSPAAAAPEEPAVGGPPAGDAPLVLDLEALELTWVLVRVDGGGVREALLRPGDRIRLKGTEQFALTLGNAGGVRVELNGKEQGPFGPKGKVARDVVLRR